MKVNKKTGLVAVVNSRTGEVYGVDPDRARLGLPAGEFTLLPDEELAKVQGAEFDDVDNPDVELAAAAKPAKATVVIPDGWEQEHGLRRIALARQIDPNHKAEDEETKSEAADRVIRAELARRGEGEGILTTLAPAGGGEQGTANFTPAPDQGLAEVVHATNVGPVGGEAGTANVTPAKEPGAEAPALTTIDPNTAAPAVTTDTVAGDPAAAPAAAAADAKPKATVSTDSSPKTDAKASEPAKAKGDKPADADADKK